MTRTGIDLKRLDAGLQIGRRSGMGLFHQRRTKASRCVDMAFPIGVSRPVLYPGGTPAGAASRRSPPSSVGGVGELQLGRRRAPWEPGSSLAGEVMVTGSTVLTIRGRRCREPARWHCARRATAPRMRHYHSSLATAERHGTQLPVIQRNPDGLGRLAGVLIAEADPTAGAR